MTLGMLAQKVIAEIVQRRSLPPKSLEQRLVGAGRDVRFLIIMVTGASAGTYVSLHSRRSPYFYTRSDNAAPSSLDKFRRMLEHKDPG